MTPDPKRAAEFYTQLFGYGTQDFPIERGAYIVLIHKGQQAAGITEAPQPGGRPQRGPPTSRWPTRTPPSTRPPASGRTP
jgi:predicted enzyme related to lactoylglutathione lyase